MFVWMYEIAVFVHPNISISIEFDIGALSSLEPEEQNSTNDFEFESI